MPTRARERLLDTADDLFYADGIRAVGLERILSTSGVGRASFYRHFTGKDELVVAVLRRRDERFRQWLADRVAQSGGEPLAVFDAIGEFFLREDFRGCAFINTMVESADPDSVAYQVAVAHKEKVTEYLAGLLTAHGGASAAALAPHFVLLMDGAVVTALRQRSAIPAQQARIMAARLLAD